MKSGKQEGGGVPIAVYKSIYISVRIPTNVERFEQLFVRVFNSSHNIIIGAVYLDQQCNINDDLTYTDLAIVGDFNLPSFLRNSNN